MKDDLSPLSFHPRMVGNPTLLDKRLTAFLCSGGQVPDGAFASVRRWVKSLDKHSGCVLVGCLAGMERFVIRLLLEHEIPVAIVLAEALPADMDELAMMLHDFPVKEALEADRLLVVSVNDDGEDCVATSVNARRRNLWMLDKASRVVVGYLRPNGKLFCQLCGRRNVVVVK